MAALHTTTHTSVSASASNSLNMQGRDIISIQDLSIGEIKHILDTAQLMKTTQPQPVLKNKIIAQCFFEPSTRTRLSFESATFRLGGNVIGFSSDESLSVKKGETLHDTIRVISDYADLLVIRHPQEGAARLAADVSAKPVINAGDGANQHPSQTLTDLFTIRECQQRLEGLSIALVGDLKHARTIHSFAYACMLFDIRLFLVAPPALALPDALCNALKNAGVRFSFHQSVEEIISKVDIVYMTRLQLERFHHTNHLLMEKQYVITPATLEKAKENLKILHPLPRVNEIDTRVIVTTSNTILLKQQTVYLFVKHYYLCC